MDIKFNSANTKSSATKEGCEQIERVKGFLREEYSGVPINILHNKGFIILQYCGWSINLYDDGTWGWEITEGG